MQSTTTGLPWKTDKPGPEMGVLSHEFEELEYPETEGFYISRKFMYGHPPFDPKPEAAQCGMRLMVSVAVGLLEEGHQETGHQVHHRYALEYGKWEYPPGPPRQTDVDRLWEEVEPLILEAVAAWRAGKIPVEMTEPAYL